jgi:hypothetical protein
MDSVLFLTIGKLDIYHHNSLGKSATNFYPCDQYIFKLAANLPKLICDRYPTYQNTAKLHLTSRLTSRRKKYCTVYPIDFRCIC